MPAAIFNGDYIKLLKDKLRLGDTAEILTGSSVPSSIATDANKGSLYIYTGTPGAVYIKQDSGSSTNWSKIAIYGDIDLADLSVLGVGGEVSTFKNVYDNTISTGVLGTVSVTDLLTGSVLIGGGYALVRSSASDTAPVYYGAVGVSAASLTDNSMNYVYYSYNSGSPTTLVSTSDVSNGQDKILLCSVYRSGTDLHINTNVQQRASNSSTSIIKMLREAYGLQRVSGGIVAETDTRKIAITAGVFYVGDIRTTTPAFDSNGADRFTYYYRDGVGGWTAVTSQATIDNTQYDNNLVGSLATLSAGRYGVHWVYIETDGHVCVLYGQGNYTLTQARAAQPPSSVPPNLQNSHAELAAKIIVGKNDTNFYEVSSAFSITFTQTAASKHNELSGLDGGTAGEYYHFTATDYSKRVLTDNSVTLTNKTLSSPTVTAPAISGSGTITTANKIVDPTDATKAFQFDLASMTTGKTVTFQSGASNNRTLQLPDSSTSLVGHNAQATLSNKYFSDTTCKFTDVADTSKAIAFDAGGTASTTTTIAAAQTANRTLTLPDATDTLVGKATTDALTNKTLVSSGSATDALNVPTGTTAQRPAGTTGAIRHNSSISRFEGYNDGAWQSLDGGLNERPSKNYYKKYADSGVAPGTLSTLASTTSNITISGSGYAATSAFYADSTSGSAALTQDTTNALRGANSYLTALSGADTGGARFVQMPAFALDAADVGKPVSLSFDLTSSITDGDYDVVVVRYTVSSTTGTHASIISVIGNASSATVTPSAKLPTATTKFQGFFVPDSTTATDVYAVRIRRLIGSAQIKFDGTYSGPDSVVQGAAISDWQSWTPTFDGFGSPTLYYAWWRQNGSNMDMLVGFSGGTHTGTTAAYSLPGSYNRSLPSGSTSTNVGQLSASATPYTGSAVIGTSSATKVFLAANNVSFISGSVGTTWANGTAFSIQASAPIVGWSSNVTIANRAVERYFYTSESFTATGTTTVEGFAGQATANMSGTERTKTITHNMPGAKPFVELSTDGGISWFDATAYAPYNVTSLGVTIGMYILAMTATTVTVGVGGYRAIANDDSPTFDWGTGFNWRVRMVMPGGVMGYPISARNIVGDISGTTVPAGLIGETPGATARAGTGGSAYTIRSTTNPGTSSSYVKVIAQSLNKGTYIATITFSAASNAASIFSYYAAIGTTSVTQTFSSHNGAANGYAGGFIFIPIQITTDGTEFQGYAAFVSGTVSSSNHEMSIVRIA